VRQVNFTRAGFPASSTNLMRLPVMVSQYLMEVVTSFCQAVSLSIHS
jgi:hypothetical protein